MKNFTLNLTNENVTLTAYIPDSSDEMKNQAYRRAMLVIPGGAYRFCSDREAEPVAFAFVAKGYAAFILRYSLGEKSIYPNPLNDAVEALKIIRENAEEWKIRKNEIAAVGFSAGGHLTAMLSTSGAERPNAQILGYPCILEKTSEILATKIPGADSEVDDKTPPAFIFSAYEDGTVPIKNSLAYANALEKRNIPFEMHIYQKGYHGFSTADKQVYDLPDHYEYNKHCSNWVEMCLRWLDQIFE